MTKKDFWKSLDAGRRKALADKLGTSVGYLRQVFMYEKKTGAKRARLLTAEIGGVFGAHEFCPDAFDESDSLCVESRSSDAA